jgi:hypothetical protein
LIAGKSSYTALPTDTPPAYRCFYRVAVFIAIPVSQFLYQLVHQLPNALQVRSAFTRLDPVSVLPGLPFQIGLKRLGIALLVRFIQHAVVRCSTSTSKRSRVVSQMLLAI